MPNDVPNAAIRAACRRIVAAIVAVGALFLAGAGVGEAQVSPFDGPVGGELLGPTGARIIGEGADVPALPSKLDAKAWLVADAGTGDVLAAFNPHQPLPPASTLKLLTAVTLLPGLDPDLIYTATDDDANVEGSRVGLVPDETYTLADLEHGLMLASGNDAAHALSVISGGLDVAVAAMNAEADRLGAFDTTAKTPHGLDTPGQLSSAYDLALFGRTALADEHIATLARTPSYAFPGLDGSSFQIQNQNRLLGSYHGTIGLKTGYTTAAGHTLVAAAQRKDTRLIVVVLGADRRAEPPAEALLDWGFAASGGVEPVGHLVTPDEVAAATPAAAPSSSPAASEPGPGREPSAGSAPIALDVPRWGWAGLAGAAGAGLVVAFWRRGSRKAGRYASRRM